MNPMNPMMQSLNGTKIGGILAPIKTMMNTVMSAGNPAMMLQQQAQKNPLVKEALDIVQKHGGDMEAAFKDTAQQLGASPGDIMNMLK